MFFIKALDRDIIMEPRFFGPKLKATVRDRLLNAVEGKCIGNDGFVVMIHQIDDEQIGKGTIEIDTGCVKYKINFQALVFRPFRNEVIDAIVYRANEAGVLARAGPLEIFVTRKLMPEELRDGFDTVRECYVDHEDNVEVKAGVKVRIRILGVKYQLDRIDGTGTMLGDFLGPVPE